MVPGQCIQSNDPIAPGWERGPNLWLEVMNFTMLRVEQSSAMNFAESLSSWGLYFKRVLPFLGNERHSLTDVCTIMMHITVIILDFMFSM